MPDLNNLLSRLDAKALTLSTMSVRALAQGEMVATALLLEESAKAIRELIAQPAQERDRG